MNTPQMQQLLDDFALFDDWEDKYGYLIDLGKTLPHLDESEKIDLHKVHGCTSQVWLIHETSGDEPLHHFRGDSDAHIVRGLVALLLRIYSGQTAETINAIDMQAFFAQLGFSHYLSPSRSNGFFAMIERIKTDVVA